MKTAQKKQFLDEHIFKGLTDLNTGFDVPSIKYFSEDDFKIVLDRVEQYKIGIYGIEPWKDGEYFGTSVYELYNLEPDDPMWYRIAYSEFLAGCEDLQYSASYTIPKELLKEE